MRSTRLCTTAIASWRRSSLPEEITNLFAEYADAYARGERPRAEEFLARAGGQADELARLLKRFVRLAPAHEPDAATLALTEAALTGEPPLIILRASQGIRVDDVVDALVERLELDKTKRAKLKGYYQRLEGGLLDSARVSRRVWEVLGSVVGPRSKELATWQPPHAVASGVYLRATEAAAPPRAPLAQRNREEPDEIDRLFLGGDE
jgi:hypothetical protein